MSQSCDEECCASSIPRRVTFAMGVTVLLMIITAVRTGQAAWLVVSCIGPAVLIGERATRHSMRSPAQHGTSDAQRRSAKSLTTGETDE